MRIQIDGNRSLITGLGEAFPDAEPVVEEPDLTEQKFGFAEVASIIAIVQGVAELAKIISDHLQERAARGDRNAQPQTLRLRSAIGTVVIEVSPETTVEEFEAALAPLVPGRR